MIQLTRTIQMKKTDVIAHLLKNKKTHIEEYRLAVIAFKKTGLKMLAKTTKAITKGDLRLQVSLTSPVNRKNYFDNVISMFQSDIRKEVELTQNEYNEYILDEGSQSVQASFANSMYYSEAGIRGPKGSKGIRG